MFNLCPNPMTFAADAGGQESIYGSGWGVDRVAPPKHKPSRPNHIR